MKDCNNSVHWDFFVAVKLQTKCDNLVKEGKILKMVILGEDPSQFCFYERTQNCGKICLATIEAFKLQRGKTGTGVRFCKRFINLRAV